jgi:hypothetical protein
MTIYYYNNMGIIGHVCTCELYGGNVRLRLHRRGAYVCWLYGEHSDVRWCRALAVRWVELIES